ncbi:MAG: hypothetical protein ACRCZI_05365 [Cetobacterium sp.]
MDTATFLTLVTRLDVTLGQLEKTVAKLTEEVETLKTKQTYWSGAVTAIGVMCSGIGAIAALGFQWITSR